MAASGGREGSAWRATTRAQRLVRWCSLGLAAASAAGLVTLSTPTSGQAAPTDDAVTIAWAGGNTPELQQFQPDRDPASIHYGDFRDVQVSVSKTTDLVDEAVTVTVTGMAGATKQLQGYLSSYGMGGNFVQAMQCWGSPADADFYKNCLWGAWTVSAGSAAPASGEGTLTRGGYGNGKSAVPFRAVTGREYSGDKVLVNGSYDSELMQVVRPETTNERTVMVDATGTADFLFEVQAASAQPYLGCGDKTSATGTRCWLVVVPRGTHASPATEDCFLRTGGRDDASLQQNSPVNPACQYWGNRLVVPLEFRPTGPPCPPGRSEVRVSGNQGVAEAFASWQAGICHTGGSAYTLTTSSDRLVREQLLSGVASMAITSRPLTEDWLGEGYDHEALAGSRLVYAPVAVSGVVIAFLANKGGQIETEIRLSPRLVAKLVTGSYALEQSLYYYFEDRIVGPWRGAKGTVLRLNNDPEFKALNPEGVLNQGGMLIMTGPDSADGIAQLWAYLQADDAARAFLAGDADNIRPGDEDNAGMTLNPWYLPKGHPDARVPVFTEVPSSGGGTTLLPVRDEAGQVQWREVGLTYVDGTPMCLCDAPKDSFAREDQTELPQQTVSAVQWRYDIVQQRPYAAGLGAAARMLFRADIGSKTFWDSSQPNGAVTGAYSSDGVSNLNAVFLTGYTGTAEAARYGLATASLGVPNWPGVFVDADEPAMAAAVAAQSDTGVGGVGVTDPAALPADAYPLTTVIYAAVNLNVLDRSEMNDYADLIEFAATAGQTPGSSVGQLPAGYLPLTDALRDQALTAVETIRNTTKPDEDNPPESPGNDPIDDPPQGDPADRPPSSGIATDPPEDGAPPNAPLGDRAAIATPDGRTTVTPSASSSNSPATDPPSGGTSSPPGSNDQGQEFADRQPNPDQDNPPTGDNTADPQGQSTGTEVFPGEDDPAALPTTPAVEASPARGALGGALATGLAGMVAGPLLLRRRGDTP